MTGAVVWIIRMPAAQRCRSLRLKERTHAACHQAVAGLGERTRHEGQQCEVQRSQDSRMASTHAADYFSAT